MKRRDTFALAVAPLGLTAPLQAAAQGGGKKVLRVSFRTAETGFDPAQINDIYSRTVTPHIFEAPYQYDPLARPALVRPLTADGMPEHADDYKTWTVKIRPGIYFADDPAFKGQKARAGGAGLCLCLQALCRPAGQEPGLDLAGDLRDPGPDRTAQAGDREQEALRLRHADRRH